MKTLLWVAVAALVVAAPVLVLAFAPAPDAGSRSVEYKTYNGYAESRDSGLKGDASFLAIPSRTEFTRVLTPVLTPRGTPDPVPKDAFDTQFFAAVIKRSDVLWDYKVEKVTADDGTLYVRYTAKMGEAGTATFHSPLIVSVDKDKYTSVVFIENGKKAETVKVAK